MEPKNYKVYSNGIHEIITADLVQYMPATGQTCFFLNGEMLHIAPAKVMVTNTCEKDYFIRKHDNLRYTIQKKIDALIEKRSVLVDAKRPDPNSLNELEKELLNVYNENIKALIEVRDELYNER